MADKMTLADFRETARIVMEADEERIEYLGGSCRIDLVIGGRHGDPAEGMFCLTIANSSDQGFDLAEFEASLFKWAQSEGLA
jgi:hypothetical protein